MNQAGAATPFADAIVVAAGTSSRMGGIDKLGVVVGGRPILAHALEAIAAAPEIRRIVIVTSEDRIEAVAKAEWLPAAVDLVVSGGARRQDSVRRGLAQLLGNAFEGGGEPEVILVHDGARPLVPPALVSAIAAAARLHGAAIPVVAVPDTVKRVAPDGTVVGAGDRSTLRAAQTPQGIRTDILREAFERVGADADAFSDEAALLEACKLPVHAIPGDERNFKVTVPGDVTRAAALLGTADAAARSPDGWTGPAGVRVGFGTDSHPFGPAMGLALGGLVVDHAPRLHGHSDGDVLLHAIADAMLGAAGRGDLGRVFPADRRTSIGIASTAMLSEVARGIRSHGYLVATVDGTIVGARPHLADRLPEMGERIADLLAVDPSAVNVKASTGNLAGMEGAGRGISASVVVTLRPVGVGR